MGQASSSSPLEQCLSNVCSGRSNCVGFPSNPLYQIQWVKPYNLDLQVTPAAVVRPSNANDVAAVVKCATQNGVKVQAKSGGHSYGNYGLGGDSGAVAIDMVNFQGFSMDTNTWYATIGAGSLLGDVTQKAHDNGQRAFAHGVCPGVGLGGHATIGGLGPMSRMWGSCLDHVVEVEVVTADGSIKRASASENQELFFALRGAGAGYGVITQFVMRTHPEPGEVVQFNFDLTFGSAADAVTNYKMWQDLIADPALDRRFGTEFILHPLGAVITGTFYGTQQEFEASGIRQRLPQTGQNTIAVNDWLGSILHDGENEALYISNLATPFYSKSLAFRRDELLSQSAIGDLFSFLDGQSKGTLIWFIIFDATGGAVADVPLNATAYAHRDKVLFYQSYAVDVLGISPTTRSFLNDFHNKVRSLIPAGTYGTYPGYVDPALTDAPQEYWMSNLATLGQIKSIWDPNDVFHNPQSVRPGAR